MLGRIIIQVTGMIWPKTNKIYLLEGTEGAPHHLPTIIPLAEAAATVTKCGSVLETFGPVSKRSLVLPQHHPNSQLRAFDLWETRRHKPNAERGPEDD